MILLFDDKGKSYKNEKIDGDHRKLTVQLKTKRRRVHRKEFFRRTVS